MYIVAIAWLYVALMMAVAEATSPIGTVLGAVFTFLLYGLAPVALMMYLLGTPARRRRLKAAEAAAREAAIRAHSGAHSAPPDASGKAPADAIAPVREKP
jgi:hypothetical protein